MSARTRIATLGLAVLALTALAVASAEASCPRAEAGVRVPTGLESARIRFVGLLGNGDSLVGVGVRFYADTLRDLVIRVVWLELPGTHTQRLEVFTPSGNLYRRFVTGFTTNQNRRATVQTHVPVKGTAMTESSLFGRWCAEVYLDSDEAPVVGGAFVLKSKTP